jgi:glycosyltransferase involved in cell wall biosynthesis
VLAVLLGLLSRPNVVVLNHLNFAPLACLARIARPGSRIVIWAYGAEAWQRPSLLGRIGLHFVDQIWSISEFTAGKVATSAGIPSQKIVTVPLALLPEQAAALSGPLEEDPDLGAEVLTVSRLWTRYEKGVDRLIEALPLVRRDIRLVVVGDGDDRPRLEQLAHAVGPRQHVIFAGQVDDAALVRRYQGSQVFALPSGREGFGLVVLEAMMAAKPVVAVRAGATPELVRDGETGLLVPVDDQAALASAIESLVGDRMLAEALGRRGREIAQREYGFDRFSSRVMALLSA